MGRYTYSILSDFEKSEGAIGFTMIFLFIVLWKILFGGVKMFKSNFYGTCMCRYMSSIENRSLIELRAVKITTSPMVFEIFAMNWKKLRY